MKKLLIIFSLLFCVAGAKAQIIAEHTYSRGAISYQDLHIVHFSSQGYKYAIVNSIDSGGYINLYNLNHSLYKSFAIPTMPHSAGNGRSISVEYISDSLFNTNPTNIEYFAEDIDINGIYHVRVFDDIGNTVFSKDSVTYAEILVPFPYVEWIFYTPNGYKMILQEQYNFGGDTSATVYSLPGALPCSECSNNNLITSTQPLLQQNNGSLLNAYPNPAKNSTTIKYELPDGVNQGDIIFYDLQGRQVKTLTVDRTFDSLLVSTAELAAGTYFYILRAGGNYVGSKKVVIIK
jgi:hypothetical protein